MWKKRVNLLLVLVLTLSLLGMTAGCTQEETAVEVTPSPEVEQVDAGAILTDAAIDYFTYLPAGSNMIDAQKLKDQLSNLYVLDIRATADFATGHIPTATNKPMAEVGQIIPSLPTNQTIVVVCYSGQTASQTVGVLRMAGFDAIALKGGFPAWSKAEFEIEQ